ncbi:hypothetical protein FSP39_016324 [Pinctada imbricata]|uniref:Uncharacterized protein n=1 Tax=Pinctada imbricata TaxID=66713 RepID=A0AA89C5J9_PINIB|nr:hypothetical protein FSP39_016324 [Pinctada imbricata]
MPFGLCNSPATFERLMEKVLARLTWRKCLLFIDDIIVYSKSFDEQIQNLEEVFQRLQEAKLKLNPHKCVLLQKQVSFLGHVISENGVSTDPKKIQDVIEWPTPRTVKDVRSFLGLCSYYRKFVLNFSTIAKPLTKLTEKNQNFRWTNECEIAFQKLKQALVSAPILAYPQSEGKFILDTDASNLGMGAVLSQIQGNQEKVICYFSKTFSKSERHYCVTRKELLAIVAAIKQFHHYLYGRNFLVRSDHGALRWLFNFKKPEGQMARWLEQLATYDFTIEHRAGRIHNNADALSRRPCENECKYCEKVELKYENVRSENSQEKLPEVGHTSKNFTGTSNVDMNEISEGTISDDNSESREDREVDGRNSSEKGGDSPFTTVPFCELCPLEEQRCDCQVRNTISSRNSHQNTTQSSENETRPRDSQDSRNMRSSSLGDDSSMLESQSVRVRSTNISVSTLRSGKERNVETEINLSTVNKELLVRLQRNDSVLGKLMKWKEQNVKPSWSDVAQFSVEMKFYWNRIDSLVVQNGVLYRKFESIDGQTPELHIVLPKELRSLVLKELHDNPTGGHLGIKKTIDKVKKRFFWYGLSRFVEKWCSKCDVCSARKLPVRKPKYSMRQYHVGAPLERIGMDIIGPLPKTKKGNKYILVMCDYFTKWIDAVPMKNQEAVTVARKFVKHFVTKHGVPLQVHTDQGSNFESLIFKEMCKILGTEKTRTTTFRPQSDGLVERANRTIQNMLSSYVNTNQRDWDEFLSLVTMAYNSSIHATTGFSPSKLLYGREITLPIDLVFGKPVREELNYDTFFASELDEKLEQIHELARKRIKYASDVQKRHYDHKVHENSYKERDLVWYFDPLYKQGKNKKLSKPWKGPFVVTKKINDVIYKIQLNQKAKPKIVHHDRLKLYMGDQKCSWYQ